jgi:hypothetical protein
MRFNKDRVTVTPQRNGGVSYLAKPVGPGEYEFWLYICPLNAEFSAKAAVRKLREVVASGVAPWGCFKLERRPLMDYLVLNTSKTKLPTEAGKMAEMIWAQNQKQEELKELALVKSRVLNHYEELE